METNKPDEQSKGALRRTFNQRGKALVVAMEERMANTQDEQALQRMHEAARAFLDAAMELPDNPRKHKGGDQYNAGESNKPSVTIQLFGCIYTLQKDPANQTLRAKVVQLGLAHFRVRDQMARAAREAAKKAERAAKRERQQGRTKPTMARRAGNWQYGGGAREKHLEAVIAGSKTRK